MGRRSFIAGGFRTNCFASITASLSFTYPVCVAEILLTISGPVPPLPAPTCAAFRHATEAFQRMGIDSKYLDPSANQCYCDACFKDPDTFTCGKPAAQCVHPIGWVRFGVKVNEAHLDPSSYTAYHGTHSALIASILKNNGLLLRPGLVTVDNVKLQVPPGHYEDSDALLLVPVPVDSTCAFPRPKMRIIRRDMAKVMDDEKKRLGRDELSEAELKDLQYHMTEAEKLRYKQKGHPDGITINLPNKYLFTTPAVKYAELYASKTDDGHGGQFQVVFQVQQRPDSFTVLHKTMGLKGKGITLDPHYKNDELEWFTEALAAIVITGILIKVTGRPAEPARPTAVSTSTAPAATAAVAIPPASASALPCMRRDVGCHAC